MGLEYEIKMLDEEFVNGEKDVKYGIEIDDILVRVDDVYFEPNEETNDDNDHYLCVDYKFIDKVPENLVEFDEKLTQIVVSLIAQQEADMMNNGE